VKARHSARLRPQPSRFTGARVSDPAVCPAQFQTLR
jgi:hypothetical protein